MNHADMHSGHGAPAVGRPRRDASLNRLALAATIHCLTGCAIGEVLGLMIGTALGWPNGPTIALAVALAFLFGYALTLRPLLGSGMTLRAALPLALASDTLSISLMEIVDNGVMLSVPGAMEAHLHEPLFWGSMGGSLLLAGLAAWPLNRWLIARGRGHALVHAAHAGHADPAAHVGPAAHAEPAVHVGTAAHAEPAVHVGTAAHAGHANHAGHAMGTGDVSRPGASGPPRGRSTGCASCPPPSSGS